MSELIDSLVEQQLKTRNEPNTKPATIPSIDNLVEQQINDNAQSAFRSDVPFEQATKAKEVSKLTNLSPEQALITVEDKKVEPEKIKTERYIATDLKKDAPNVMARAAKDPLFANMTKADIYNIGTVERLSRNLGAGAVQGVRYTVLGTGHLADMAARKWGDETEQEQAKRFLRISKELNKRLAQVEEDLQVITGYGDEVTKGLGQLLGQAPLFFVNPAVGTAVTFSQGAGIMAESVEGDNAPQERKDLAILGGAAVTGLTERLAFGRLLKRVPDKGVTLSASTIRIGKAGAIEGIQEATESIAHDAIRQATTNPDVQIGQTALREGEVAFGVGAVARALFEGALHIRRRFRGNVEQSVKEAQTVNELMNTVKRTKLAKHSPEGLKDALSEAVDKNVHRLYVAPDVLERAYAQEGVELSSEKPELFKEIKRAKLLRTDVSVKPSELLTDYAQGKVSDEIKQHVKVRMDAFTPYELETKGEEIEAEINEAEKYAQEAIAEETQKQISAQTVKQALKDELSKIPNISAEVADKYATLVAEYYKATGERLGMTAEELFSVAPLNVLNETAFNELVAGDHTALEFGETQVRKKAIYADIVKSYDAVNSVLQKPDRIEYTPETGEVVIPQEKGEPLRIIVDKGLPDKQTALEGAFKQVADAYEKAILDEAQTAIETLNSQFEQLNQEAYLSTDVFTANVSDLMVDTPWGSAIVATTNKGQAGKYFVKNIDTALVEEIKKSHQLSDEAIEYALDLAKHRYTGAAFQKEMTIFIRDNEPDARDIHGAVKKLIKLTDGTVLYQLWTPDSITRNYRSNDDVPMEALDVLKDLGIPDFVFYNAPNLGAFFARLSNEFGIKPFNEFIDFIDTYEDENGTLYLINPEKAFVQKIDGETPENLYVFHNLQENSLHMINQIGGLPAPSIGVSSTNQPVTSFGEITLLGSKDLIDDTEVYSTDIWSVRMPRINIRFDTNLLDEVLGDLPIKLDDTPYDTTDLIDSTAMFARWALDKGLYSLEEDYRTVPEHLEPWADKIRSDSLTDADYAEIGRISLEKTLKALEERKAQGELKGFLLKSYEFAKQALKDREALIAEGKAEIGKTDFKYSSFEYLKNVYLRHLRSQHFMDNPEDEADYQRWVSQISLAAALEFYFRDPETGKEKPATAQQLLNSMRGGLSGDKRGQESLSAPAYALIAKEMTDIGEIRAQANRTDNELYMPYRWVLQEVHDRLVRLGMPPALKKPEDNESKNLLAGSNLSIFLEVLINPEEMIYPYVPAEEADPLIAEAISIAQKAPVEYLEAKPDRVVKLNEFGAAIVPDTVAPETIQLLKEQGLEVKTYSDDHERALHIAQARGLLFQKQALSGQTINGFFVPNLNLIVLAQNADLTTFLHESGHAFLENHLRAFALLDKQVRNLGYETLTEGQKAVYKDMQRVLAWFGLKDYAEWENLSLDERRALHEQFAESFERYLLEGKAPSLELRKPFSAFRAWLLAVYKSMKSFLKGRPLANKFTPEIKEVFDRMLATDEAIEEAANLLNYKSLLKDALDAGMAVEDFARLVAIDADALDQIKADASAEGVRDLRIIDNKIEKVVKSLKQEAKALRKQAQLEARRNVLQSPVYRAWAYLSAKQGIIFKGFEPQKKKKSTHVDPLHDDILTAIAKLGGIYREDFTSTYGYDDPNYFKIRPIFGKPVFRKEGGKSIGEIEELLAEEGYLTLDVNGKYDTHEFEEKLFDALSGKKVYSQYYEPDPEEILGTDIVGAFIDPEMYDGAKLDWQALYETEGVTIEDIERLKKLGMVAAKKLKGADPNVLAEYFGFASGQEMVKALLEVKPLKDAIEEETARIMRERYSEYADENTLRTMAYEKLNDEARQKFVREFIKALDKGERFTPEQVQKMKQTADALLNEIPIMDLRPSVYLRGETRAMKEARLLMRRGDMAGAINALRAAHFNQILYKQAVEIQKDAEKILNYLRRFDRKKKPVRIDGEYWAQIQNILADYDLLKSVSKKDLRKRQSLRAWYEKQVEEYGIVPDIDPSILDRAGKVSWKELTGEQLTALRDAIKTIEHLGKTKERLKALANNRRYEQVRDELHETIVSVAKERGITPERARAPATWRERVAQSLKHYGAMHLRAGTVAYVLDGGDKRKGAFWRYFIAPANERADWEASKVIETSKKLDEITKPFRERDLRSKKYFPSVDESLTHEQVIAIALNWGNPSNRQRLLDGNGWTEEQVTPLLQELTADEWGAVQNVWDLFESFWPDVEAREKRVYGVVPPRVEPMPFEVQTVDGKTVELRGGYYPVKYDPNASTKAADFAEAERLMEEKSGSFFSALPRRTFAKARADKVVGRPLLLDISVIGQSLQELIHSLAWHEYLIEANRLMKSPAVRDEILRYYGREYVDILKTWLKNIAKGSKAAETRMDNVFNRLRQNASIAGLGFNMTTALLQLTGFANGAEKTGITNMTSATMKLFARPKEQIKFIEENSPFMVARATTRYRDLYDYVSQIEPAKGKLTQFQQMAFIPISFVQAWVDRATWLAAYEEATKQGQSHEDAVKYADQTVRDTQGSGLVSDLNPYEGGSAFSRMFTVFQSFMFTVLNRLYVINKDLDRTTAEKALGYTLAYLVPIAAGALIREYAKAGDGCEDFECVAKEMAGEGISFALGMFFVVRELSVLGNLVNDGYVGYHGVATLGVINSIIELSKQVAQGEMDSTLLKQFVSTLGYGVGLPAAAINRIVTAAENAPDDPFAYLFGVAKKK